jgi:hypothetical protein
MGPIGLITFGEEIYRNQMIQKVSEQRNVVSQVMDAYSVQTRGGINMANTTQWGLSLYYFYRMCANPIAMVIFFLLAIVGLLGSVLKFIPREASIASGIITFVGVFFLMNGLVGSLEFFKSIVLSWRGIFISLLVAMFFGGVATALGYFLTL